MKTSLMAAVLSLPTLIALETAHSQAIYSVVPDSKGNRLELTIVNSSPGVAAENVRVVFTKMSRHLVFASSEASIRSIAPLQSAPVGFAFDVARSAPVNRQDTLAYAIADADGATVTRYVIIRYKGPEAFALEQNFPNPFNPSTTIRYQLPVDARVTLRLYDVLGREVRTLVDETKRAGYYEAVVDGSALASGVYFYRMEARTDNGTTSFDQVRKLVLLK